MNRDDLERLLQLKIPISQIARQLNVARCTIYKSIEHYGIIYEQFSRMLQADVEREVEHIKKDHPNAGKVMVQGHLMSIVIHHGFVAAHNSHRISTEGNRTQSNCSGATLGLYS